MDEKTKLTADEYPISAAAPPALLAYIALGANLGDREQNLKAAIEKIGEISGVRVTKVSAFFETEPVGGPPQGMYLNAAVEIDCTIPAGQLLRELQGVEKELGRKRLGKCFPRTIDLDILLFGSEVIDEMDLKVPHPRMHDRAFVLDPLNEIAPNAIHPILGLTVAELTRMYRERHTDK
ncbi:2-amino-4-hydroxy-6-hydroxymethyldihydropteridine diphosphokinase [bacterium]|nr:2-amino-4-hydroxy-6-hydroxymethyldihydropteridine diphosphokinase [bacterium]